MLVGFCIRRSWSKQTTVGAKQGSVRHHFHQDISPCLLRAETLHPLAILVADSLRRKHAHDSISDNTQLKFAMLAPSAHMTISRMSCETVFVLGYIHLEAGRSSFPLSYSRRKKYNRRHEDYQ